jgi:hypothetical protein
MTEEMFPIVTHDADRERIRARARLTRDVLADLEEAALSAASRHTHQIDALKTELAEAHRQLDARPAVDSMTVGLDDIRAILAEETHTTVQELLVIEDGQVQVVDSLHQLLAHIIAVATAWPDGETESLRKSLAWTQEELAKSKAAHIASIKGATNNADADADMWDEEITTLTGKVRALAEAIRPVNGAAAEIAARCDVGAAIDVVAQAVTELAGQIVDGGRGEIAQALAREQANANQIENELQAIEAVCESAGMPATVERDDIPAWLAEHLVSRVEKKAKVKRKAKAIPADDIGEGEVGDE